MKNPVAKHMRINRASVQKDRKKDLKRGYRKHKGKLHGFHREKGADKAPFVFMSPGMNDLYQMTGAEFL